MIKIINGSREFTARERYAMTLNNDIQSVNKVETGTVVEIIDYLYFQKIDEESGEIEELLTIHGKDKEGNSTYWCTKSPTFKDSFSDICDIITDARGDGDTNPFYLKKLDGTSKNGREYVDCSMI